MILKDIAAIVGAKLTLPDQGELSIVGVKPLAEAKEGDISFLENPKYVQDAKATKATAVFVSEKNAALLPKGVVPLLTPMPYVAFAQTLGAMYPPQLKRGVHPTAVVDDTAQIDDTAYIGPQCIIGENVKIGARTQICGQTMIQHTVIGADGLIHPGAQIGQDGFGFAEFGGQIVKIPQVGTVEIGDRVEIGANTTIDRGALSATVIGSGTKIDNQVQIGHNVRIGENVRICGQSGIAGSAILEKGCLIGAQAGVAGHVTVASFTQLAARGGITKTISEPKQTLAGMPAIDIKVWRKQQVAIARLLKKK